MEDRFDPESIRPGVPTIGSPPTPSGVAPDDAYAVKILRSEATGTDTLAGVGSISRHENELREVQDILTLTPRDAAKVGLYRLIRGLQWRAFDLQKVVDGDPKIFIQRFGFDRIFLDWADWLKEEMPAQAAVVTSPDDSQWDSAGLSPYLIEESLDVFMPDTLLRYLGEFTIPLMMITVSAHKDQRRGLEDALVKVLAAEPHDDRGGRRVIVPEYFSREIRFMLESTARPDTSLGAHSNQWPLEISVSATVEQVVLVHSPGTVAGVEFDVAAE